MFQQTLQTEKPAPFCITGSLFDGYILRPMFVISARSSTPGLIEERPVDAWCTRDRIQAGPNVLVSPDIFLNVMVSHWAS
jgi:hypothetical protein